jgi:hypothetical protein
LDIGEADERCVEAAEVGGERDDSAHVEDMADGKDASPAKSQRRGNGGDHGQRGEEQAASSTSSLSDHFMGSQPSGSISNASVSR